MRIGGLASGMDVDTMIKNLMKAERLPYNKLSQKKQVLEWQRDDYRQVNTSLKQLDTFLFDNLVLQGSTMTKKTSSTGESVVTATANSSAANVSSNIKVDRLASSATWVSEGNAKSFEARNGDLSLKVTSGSGVLKDKEVTVSISATDTVKDIAAKLSNDKDLNVSVIYDEVSGKMSITSKDTGQAGSIVLGDEETVKFFQTLGFSFSSAAPNQELTGKTAGTDALFTINGLTTTRSSNTFSMNNVTYTLKGEGSSTVSVSNNNDALFDKIVQFVGKYNDTIESLNKKINEERYKGYQPLSQDERNELSEKQIEQWEEKAKSGLLRRDSLISSGLTSMRTQLYNPVSINSEFKQLSAIGITTTSNYQENGKLKIDENKLREAIGKDPNAVFQLFSADGATPAEKGLARRLRNSIKDTVGKIEERAGNATKTNQSFAIGRNLINLDSQMNRFESRLKQVEDRYWRQFTAMEKAISKSNDQYSFLMQQFSGN
ncbi:flagellar hook-associated protein 2 [Bacillus lacus]|uniref:Flagellar hook-associated protein 2 n=1 Tax=Metabacillus lacus TaxID=1983721 RepID=A0A7X2IYL9_9BACI|nr:flagellar hook-associated protein 2 [Metabacillus lacus]MRX72196.1 flagellar hook-associated protein 2 [Metabacillus lacus]